MLGEAEGAAGESIHNVQRDLLDLFTVEPDKVVLEDQEGFVRDEDETLLFIVPVIHPEATRETFSHHICDKDSLL